MDNFTDFLDEINAELKIIKENEITEPDIKLPDQNPKITRIASLKIRKLYELQRRMTERMNFIAHNCTADCENGEITPECNKCMALKYKRKSINNIIWLSLVNNFPELINYRIQIFKGWQISISDPGDVEIEFSPIPGEAFIVDNPNYGIEN
jgi:hypothetical protein